MVHMIESGFKFDRGTNKFLKPPKKVMNGDEAAPKDETDSKPPPEKLFMRMRTVKNELNAGRFIQNGAVSLYDGKVLALCQCFTSTFM